jgi:Tfp pilus assembly protein PilV
MRHLRLSEKGLTIFEALVAMALTSIVLLTHANGLIQSQKTYWMNRRSSLALQQAESLMEQYSVKDIATLSSANNLTENNYLYNGMRFNRAVYVVDDVNGTKTVYVVIAPVKSGGGGSATLVRTFVALGD